MRFLHLPFIQKATVFISESVKVMLFDKFSATRFRSCTMKGRLIVCGAHAKHSIERNGIRTT